MGHLLISMVILRERKKKFTFLKPLSQVSKTLSEETKAYLLACGFGEASAAHTAT